MQLLFNHTSPETAYLVDDYPYGFRLRCKIRYWLEWKNKKGFRLVSQTTNPKASDVWNKPKKSTYCMAGAMYLDEKNYVQWDGFNYYDLKRALEWTKQFGEAVPEIGRSTLRALLAYAIVYEEKKLQNRIAITIGGETKPVESDFTREQFEEIKAEAKAVIESLK